MFAKPGYHRSVYVSLAWLLIASLALTACTPPATPTAPPEPIQKLPPTVKLTVANVASTGGSVTSVREGESAAIVVDIDPYEELDWTWEVSGTSGGSLNASEGENVIYLAGKAGIDTVTARATLTDGTGIKQFVTFNVAPAATEIPLPTETPPPPRVTLDNLQNDQKVPCSNVVSGTYPDGLDKAIWPVVVVGGRFHPQDEGGKAAQMANGQWYQTVRFGDCLNTPNKDIGVPFQLIIVTANQSANAAFEAYLVNGQKTGEWGGMTALPAGIEEQVRIVVIRE